MLIFRCWTGARWAAARATSASTTARRSPAASRWWRAGSNAPARCASRSPPTSTSDTARASATGSISSRRAEKAPTLLFIHGGYWQNRAKEVFSISPKGPMAHGINVALIGYTLAPDATLDEIVAEIYAGIDHLARQLPALGAAAEGIVVSGWSAGGHLTSMSLSNPMCARGWRSQASQPRADQALLSQRKAEARRSDVAPQFADDGGGRTEAVSLVVGSAELPLLRSRPPISPATAREADCR